jgi:calcineurin-like phosphoesterase family protein
MANVRFIGCLHFGHRNMAIKRGFRDEFEYEEYVVKQWNYVVNKKDTTYLLGDITMEKANYEILNRLNGIKHVILGNHDESQHTKHMQNYVNKIAGMVNYKKEFILTHCPIHPCELEYRFKYNIHGHVHTNSLTDDRYINVCAEMIDYKPKLLRELLNGR